MSATPPPKRLRRAPLVGAASGPPKPVPLRLLRKVADRSC